MFFKILFSKSLLQELSSLSEFTHMTNTYLTPNTRYQARHRGNSNEQNKVTASMEEVGEEESKQKTNKQTK